MSESKGPKRRRVALPEINQFPRVGKIRLGEQVPTKSGASLRPSKIDYFRVEAEESGVTSAEAADSFHEVYGAEPKSLRCVLPGPTPDSVFEGAWRLYGQSKLKRICDGTTCDERTATGGWAESPCICSARGLAPTDKERCKLTWSLQVLLPDVKGVGVWQIDTGSEISVRRVSGWLQMMHRLLGDLSMTEFVLDLLETKVAPEGKSTSVYVLQPRATGMTPREMLEGGGRAERVALEPGPAMPEIPPPLIEEVDAETGEVLDGDVEPESGVEGEPPTEQWYERLEMLRGYGLTDAKIGEVCKAAGIASAKGLGPLPDAEWEQVRGSAWKVAEELAGRGKSSEEIPF